MTSRRGTQPTCVLEEQLKESPSARHSLEGRELLCCSLSNYLTAISLGTNSTTSFAVTKRIPGNRQEGRSTYMEPAATLGDSPLELEPTVENVESVSC